MTEVWDGLYCFPRKMKTPSPILCLLLSLASIAGAADFTVTNASDAGAGSLRQAILDANANPNVGGQDRIIFNIPGPGVHVIRVGFALLPQITDPVIIDGYTQPGAQPNTQSVGNNAVILIQIDTQPAGGRGLQITAGTSIVRGLSITGFNSYGIILEGLGGANIIEGNFIGVGPDGKTGQGGNQAIRVLTAGNMIGGTTAAARNVIRSASMGVFVQAQPNTICGNYIGTDAAGFAPLGQNAGVMVSNVTGGVVIGGNTAGAGNVISAFYTTISLSSANGVEIMGNWLGVASDGQTRFNNSIGVDIIKGQNNTIGGLDPASGNVIAFSGGAGVFLFRDGSNDPASSINNRILSNSISGPGPGIRLGPEGPHRNDNLDADEGLNHLQNFPVITSTTLFSNFFIVEGTLHSTPNTEFIIQLFDHAPDHRGPTRTFLKTITVMTDNSGNANFSTAVPAGNIVDATATDPAGNTSEFFLRPSNFRNLSTRARVEPGDNALIGGVIAEGYPLRQTKIIVRALGPSLAVNGTPLAGRLEDPVLEIYGRNGLISSNDNWADDPNTTAELQQYGLTPTSNLEAAAVIDPGIGGNFTAIIRGKNNSSGIAVVEFYDVVDGATMHLRNVSSRGLVQPGDNVMIGGLILQDGNGPTHVVARALGPSLTSSGIGNPLADPTLELRNSNGELLLSNDNWQEAQAAELNDVGLAPTNPAEAAILALLDQGAYTAIVRGTGNSTGIALVEFYQLP